jgi:hypothetical protein
MGFNLVFKGLIEFEFSQQTFENRQIENFVTICPVGTEFNAGSKHDQFAILRMCPKRIIEISFLQIFIEFVYILTKPDVS